MAGLLSLVSGGLFAAGFYMIMRRSIVSLIVGLIVLGHASNLLLLSGSHLVRARAPFITDGAIDPLSVSDPLPQALILTAIVIGFSVQAFAIVLIKQVYHAVGTDDLDKMRSTDRTEMEDL